MKYSKFTAGLATAGLALALTGGVGLALPTAAHASAGQYIAEVEACDGELFTVPAAEFRSKSLGNYDVPAGMSFSLLDDAQVRHLITGQLAQIQPADGVTNDRGNVTYQMPAVVDWDSVNTIEIVMGVVKDGNIVESQVLNITGRTDCVTEPLPSTESSSAPATSATPVVLVPSTTSEVSAPSSTTSEVPAPSSSAVVVLSTTSAVVAPESSPAVTSQPASITPPTAVRASGPLSAGDAWSLLLLVGGAAVLVLSGVVVVRRRA